MITLKGVSTGYKINKSQKSCRIVHSLPDLKINAGEMICLIGMNGSGKSTLIRTICRLQTPLNGSVYIDDANVNSLSDKALSKKIGVVLSTPPDIDNITANDVVAMGRYPYTGIFGKLNEIDYNIVTASIHDIGIEKLSDKLFSELSDGEKQKVMIAKTLCQQTPYIMMDEPMAFLDYSSRIEMSKLLQMLTSKMNKAVLLSTHNLELAIEMADKLWVMNTSGGFVECTPGKLLTLSLLADYFGSDTANWLTQHFRFEK